ncbi:alpha/beta fold hydrolase [Labedaea rhizosphaerae]|uniref:Pimeloyl-ACP methyl ester carboxylesterase n=1 Tax=Labedaea rhizosphaerae TaxID=598644 RepID=A0A4R6S670_LABRH|nr:alpha/beta hydrolase [Labedaea rhizosphaerae]TDP94804.1 pimeloyl-ACP methyl ester carboxylesterase [Labedaea rhizosphaerae]
MSELPVHRFPGRDGVELAYREVGHGRPIVLLHGFATSGSLWLNPGPAATIAALGYRLILPDLRGHGDSAHPRDAASYPPDVLADDGLALVDWLGLDDYDLGGYSLGGRIALRMLARGARPIRAIVAAQGFSAITRPLSPNNLYRRVLMGMLNGETFDRGTPEAEQAFWFGQGTVDPQALLHVLDAQVPTPAAELPRITTPVLVAVGDQDQGHASASELAEALPNGEFVRVPGNHFTAMTSPEFAAAVTYFLGSRSR